MMISLDGESISLLLRYVVVILSKPPAVGEAELVTHLICVHLVTAQVTGQYCGCAGGWWMVVVVAAILVGDGAPTPAHTPHLPRNTAPHRHAAGHGL